MQITRGREDPDRKPLFILWSGKSLLRFQQSDRTGRTQDGHKRLNEIRANTVWNRCIALTSKIIGKGVGAVLTAVIGIVVTAAFGVYVTKTIEQWLQ